MNYQSLNLLKEKTRRYSIQASNLIFGRRGKSNSKIQTSIPEQLHNLRMVVNGFTFDICVPRLLCTPQHFKHIKTPMLADLKSSIQK